MDAEEAYEEMIRQERDEQERQKATQEHNDEYNPFDSPMGSPVRNESVQEVPKTPAANTPVTTGGPEV